MNKLFKYGMYVLLALAVPMAFQSCNDDKDIVMIDESLPLKLDHLYMVGSATPAGWDINNPYEMQKDPADKYIFHYSGKLSEGEMKLPISKGDWGATFIYAPAANTVIDENGVASNQIDVRKGGADNKWLVKKAGIYNLTINLRDYTITATYGGEVSDGLAESTSLAMIGDASPVGWTDENQLALTKSSDSPLVFTFEGELKAGEFKLGNNNTVFKGYAGPYIQAPAAGVTLDHNGPSEQGMKIGGDDNKWKVTEPGTYKLSFDLTNRTIKVESFTAAKDPWATETLYALGTGANGDYSIDKGLAFTKVGDKFLYAGELKEGNFKFETTLKGDFNADKNFFFAPAKDTEINENGVASSAVVQGNGGSADNQWKVTKAGNYVVTVDMTNKTISVLYVGEVGSTLATYNASMMGDATPSGWSESGTALTKASDKPLTYTWEGELKAASIKFMYSSTKGFAGPMIQAPAANTAVTTAGLTGSNMVVGGADNQWKIETVGKYKITLNFTNMTVSFEYLGA